MQLTLEQLKQAIPRMEHNPNDSARYLPCINAALQEFEINTPARVACFLAQISHESGGLKYFAEIWGPTPQQLRYEPPSTLATKLGNTQPGDGHKYMGRGVLQLTGRENFRRVGHALGVDLEANPDLAATPELAFRTAGYFWKSHGLNELADQGDFLTITHRINGGENGLEERRQYWALAKAALRI
jgi:putative chitinase